jgi:ribosome-associated protein YbcJ (S4-like RNA binding protein)
MIRTNCLRAGVVLCSLIAVSACADKSKSATSSRAGAETSGEISQVEVLKAQVQEVDAAQRVIAMKDETGRPFLIEVGSNVPLGTLKQDDWVSVKYQESVAFSLKEPGESAPEPAVEHTTRRVPDGVQFGRRIDALVQIVSVTADGSHATFKVPEGMTRTVYIDDATNQRKIARLRPGDEVAVTYTEKLAVALDQ